MVYGVTLRKIGGCSPWLITQRKALGPTSNLLYIHFHRNLYNPQQTACASRVATCAGPTMGEADTGVMPLAVCGLHLSGQPLNWQLTEANAKLIRTCKSSGDYKLYAIKDPVRGITKPGMIYVTNGTGKQIHLEVWEVPLRSIGGLLQRVTRPLGFGTVVLEDKAEVYGFICEGYIAEGGENITDITSYGSWLEYLKTC